MVWIGLDHVWSSHFDQVHMHCLDTMYLLNGLRSFRGGSLAWVGRHMWMGPMVERITCYIWRGGEPFLFRLDYYLLGFVEIILLLLFRKSAVLHSTRVFLVGNTYLILKEGEVLELHFLIPAFGQSYLLQSQRYSWSRITLCCRVKQQRISCVIPWIVFQWRA